MGKFDINFSPDRSPSPISGIQQENQWTEKILAATL